MQQYNIPQFVDSEDKIFGPITIRQFAVLAIGVVIGGFLWYFKPNLGVFFISILPVIGATFAFAFVKINGQNFDILLTNIIIYIIKPTLFLWSRDVDITRSVIKITTQKKKASYMREKNEYSQSRVEEVAWTLDTYGEKTVIQDISE
jgi:uncharacterized membrane protein